MKNIVFGVENAEDGDAPLKKSEEGDKTDDKSLKLSDANLPPAQRSG
jgi:hypothetical protein